MTKTGTAVGAYALYMYEYQGWLSNIPAGTCRLLPEERGWCELYWIATEGAYRPDRALGYYLVPLRAADGKFHVSTCMML